MDIWREILIWYTVTVKLRIETYTIFFKLALNLQ